MKFLNEFIFDNQKIAQKFIKEASELFYNKGYLYYGDACKLYFKDDVDYNKYSIYKRFGWISLYKFEVEPLENNMFIVKFPEIEKISKGE